MRKFRRTTIECTISMKANACGECDYNGVTSLKEKKIDMKRETGLTIRREGRKSVSEKNRAKHKKDRQNFSQSEQIK